MGLGGIKAFVGGGGTATSSNGVISPPVALTDGATILTDASLGTLYTVTLAGNRSLATPTNPTNGQRSIWRIGQDAVGSRTLTLSSAFSFGTDLTGITLSTGASKNDFIGAIYRAGTAQWNIVAFIRGY